MVACKDWFEAIRCNETGELMRLVNKENVNTRAKEEGGGGEYTPVQFLARISPGNSPAMLEYLLSLGADLSLMAKTVDCIITRYCTTIGNLASYRINDKCKWWNSKADLDLYYKKLGEAEKLTPYSIEIEEAFGIADDIKLEKCHPKTSFMYDALKKLNQEGINVPGFSITSSVSRGARKLLRGTAAVGVGAFLLGTPAFSGGIPVYSSVSQGQSFNTRRKGGRKSKKTRARTRHS